MQTLFIHFWVTCQSGDLPEEAGFENPYVIFEVGVMKSLLTLPYKDRHMIKKWPTHLRIQRTAPKDCPY